MDPFIIHNSKHISYILKKNFPWYFYLKYEEAENAGHLLPWLHAAKTPPAIFHMEIGAAAFFSPS